MGTVARAASAYEEVVAPILNARCTECHGAQKQKGKLALHTWDALIKGSEGDPVIVANKPGESLLLQRLRLPGDDDEHMPPADKPQPSAEEIELLARWVEQGASRTATMGELKLSPKLAAAAAQLPAKLGALTKTEAEPVWELDEAAVKAARAPLAAKVAELQRRFPGALSYESRTAATLQFTAVSFGHDFGDRQLAELSPIAGQIVVLNLSGTGVTDQAAPTWKAFAQLRVLQASFTALGDETIAALQGLPKLEAVTLHATKVSAASVAALGRIPSLRVVRLGETTAAAAAREAKLPVAEATAEPDTR
jgi:hypothetical protein